ncbi:MAG TPA: UDP-N-acetylmuramoyl-L-alanyl-D-glutamate--2,6-diaminopimelate ligase [Acidimicrobiia bacterium]
MAGRRVGDLARAVEGTLQGDPDVTVTDVVHDTREAGPGKLFAALVGSRVDGHDLIPTAVDAGAPAVCVSRPVDTHVPVIRVADTRQALGPLAAEVHGHPSRDLAVVGVTGTNGKTTVTHYVEAMARASGWTPGIVGTIGARVAGEHVELGHTTPEATTFQRLLATMRERGCRLVAAEVSSHALVMGRVRATRFEVAAFTNLSQDHLDFHGDMATYLAAKESLFTDYEVGTAVINIDDPAGAGIASRIGLTTVRVGQGGDARAEDVSLGPTGADFRLVTPWGTADVTVPVWGRFNVDNVVMAAVCSLASGITFQDVVAAMADLPVVPGRFQQVSGDDPVAVFVDYAHTPAGMTQVIATAREFARGRVIAVGGAGGDRDREKRPMMGLALAEADLAVVTSDNPRSEDPGAIVTEVAAGIPEGARFVTVVDREEAIRLALAEARPGDVVLVLGRGHEPYQQFADHRVEFDDRAVVTRILAELRRESGYGRGTGRITR